MNKSGELKAEMRKTRLTDIVNNWVTDSYGNGIEVHLASQSGAADANSHILIESNSCTHSGGYACHYDCTCGDGIIVYGSTDANDGGGVTRYYYDRISRVFQTQDAGLKTVRYEYNNKGLRSRLVYPDNTSIYYYYDALGRLVKITGSGGTIAEYQYDALSRKVFVSYGNGSYIDYRYDIANKIRDVNNCFGANGAIVFNYTQYDKVGNRKNMIVNATDEHSYDYDNLYQLINVDYPDQTGMTYGYDKLGNRTSTINGEVVPYASNALNQYTWVLDWDHNNFWYDDNGNMTANGLQFIFYSYDSENRLTCSSATGGATVLYRYDYLGRLVKRSVVSGMTSKYVYDGDQIIAEYDGSNNLVRKFVYGAGIDEPVMTVVRSQETEDRYYYHYDGLGSVIALSDSSKNIVEKYSYDVFGTPTIRDAQNAVLSTSAYGNPYMFTGRQYDAQSSLYYYRARFYSPVLGRFLQPDPVMPYMQIATAGKFTGEQIPGKYLSSTALKNYLQTDPVGKFLANDPSGRFLLRMQYGMPSELNLYTYNWNNPTNWLDPWGLCKDPLALPPGAPSAFGAAGLALAFVGGLAICSGLAPAVVAGGLIAVGVGGALAVIGGILGCFGW